MTSIASMTNDEKIEELIRRIEDLFSDTNGDTYTVKVYSDGSKYTKTMDLNMHTWYIVNVISTDKSKNAVCGFDFNNNQYILRYFCTMNKYGSYDDQPLVTLRQHCFKDGDGIFRKPKTPKNSKGVWTNGSDYEYYRKNDMVNTSYITNLSDLYDAFRRSIKFALISTKRATDRRHRAEAKTDKMKELVDQENNRIEKFVQIKLNSILSSMNETMDEYAPNMVADGWKYVYVKSYGEVPKIEHIDDQIDIELKIGLQRYDEHNTPKEYTASFMETYKFTRKIDGSFVRTYSENGPFQSYYNYDTQPPTRVTDDMLYFSSVRFRHVLQNDIEKMKMIRDVDQKEDAIEKIRIKLLRLTDKAYELTNKANNSMLEFLATIE